MNRGKLYGSLERCSFSALPRRDRIFRETISRFCPYHDQTSCVHAMAFPPSGGIPWPRGWYETRRGRTASRSPHRTTPFRHSTSPTYPTSIRKVPLVFHIALLACDPGPSCGRRTNLSESSPTSSLCSIDHECPETIARGMSMWAQPLHHRHSRGERRGGPGAFQYRTNTS